MFISKLKSKSFMTAQSFKNAPLPFTSYCPKGVLLPNFGNPGLDLTKAKYK